MYENTKAVHQYYRDQLSASFTFPAIGNFPPNILMWSINGNTDIAQLNQAISPITSDLEPNQEIALKAMLQAIVLANSVLYKHASSSSRETLSELYKNVKICIDKVFKSHADPNYLINCIQLLYRINEIDIVIELANQNPQIVAQSPALQAVLAFIHTTEENYEKALEYLDILSKDEKFKSPHLISLCEMTCNYFLGNNPQHPMSFDSLDMDLSYLDKKDEILAPLEIIKPLQNRNKKPVVFAACNDAYFFQHLLHLAYSLNETNAGELTLHIHLFSPNKSVMAEIETLQEKTPNIEIGVSIEDSTASNIEVTKTYYATIRYLRAYEILQFYDNEMFIIDADALFRKSWQDFSKDLSPEVEIIMASNRGDVFWEKIAASLIYFKPKDMAKNFMAKVAQFILYNYERRLACWFLDQVALSACDDRLNSSDKILHLALKSFVDINQGTESLVWIVTEDKFGQKQYNEYRESLGSNYGSLPQATPEFLYESISKNGDIYSLQIGKSGSKTTLAKQYGWQEMLIDSLPELVEKHNPEKIDVLNICQGDKILDQFDFEKFQPKIINIDSVNISTDKTDNIQDHLIKHGYVFYQNSANIFAIKRNILFL